MSWVQRIRILPLLIVIAMMAFSLRLVDVASGVATLSKNKPAAHLQDGKQATTSHSETRIALAPAQAADDESKEMTGEGEGDNKEEMASKKEDEKPEEPDISKWQDASDGDLSVDEVKMEVFEDLVERRKKLDEIEKDLVTREALLRAAEQELERKFQELASLRRDIEKLLEKQSAEEQARVSSLVKIYEGMKPKDAAAIFNTLDLDVLVSVMSKMSERRLSGILASMNPERARTVTIMLAEQSKLPTLPDAQ